MTYSQIKWAHSAVKLRYSHIFVVYLRKYHTELNTITGQSEKEFESLREENEELKRNVFSLESKLFMKMESYRSVELKSKIKCLTPVERQQLFSDIRYVYELTIKILRQSCSQLTEDDISFCCLSKLNLDNTRLSHCTGTASRQATNQRRYRIKKKMKEANCEYLFEMIFPSEK